MKTSIIFVFVFCFIFYTPLFAQYQETIVSDRPGQTNSPYTVGKMVLQLQPGIQFGGGNADNYKRNDFEIPLFFRFGITEKIEVNTLWGLRNTRTERFSQKSKSSGLNTANFGLRFNIFEETEKAPALGFEFTYKTKMIGEDFRPDHTSTKFNIMASKGVTDLISISANLGADFNGNNAQPDGFYTLNLALSVTDELSVFFENYGFFNGDYFDTYFDFGGAYILNPNLQLDVYGGFGYNDDTFDYFVSGGISYRIVKWRKE
jgi:hypothetical protein